jgi:hypothetical protein
MPRFPWALESVLCTLALGQHRFAPMDITAIIRMPARLTATTDPAILSVACLSARGPGITATMEGATTGVATTGTATTAMATTDVATTEMATTDAEDMVTVIGRDTAIAALRVAAMLEAATQVAFMATAAQDSTVEVAAITVEAEDFTGAVDLTGAAVEVFTAEGAFMVVEDPTAEATGK